MSNLYDKLLSNISDCYMVEAKHKYVILLFLFLKKETLVKD